MLRRISNDSYHQQQTHPLVPINETLSSSSILCSDLPVNSTMDNCTYEMSFSTTMTNNLVSNSVLIIFVLSILSIFGVCFMIFGPLQRSEAYKRVENFTFGRHPIFNIDHREASTAGRYDESLEFVDE